MNTFIFDELQIICDCLDEKLKRSNITNDSKITDGEFFCIEQLLDKCLEMKWNENLRLLKE